MDEDNCVGVQGENSSLYEGEQFYEVSQFSQESGESDASESHDRSCPESLIVQRIADYSGIEPTETLLLASTLKRLEKDGSTKLQHQEQDQMALLSIQKRSEPEQMSTKVELTMWKDQFCKNQQTIELLKQEKQQLEEQVSSLRNQLRRTSENVKISEAKCRLVQRELEVGTEKFSSWKFEQEEAERRSEEQIRKGNQDCQQREKQLESEAVAINSQLKEKRVIIVNLHSKLQLIPELENKLVKRQSQIVRMGEQYQSLRDRYYQAELNLKSIKKKVDTLRQERTVEKTVYENKLLAKDQQIKVLCQGLQSMKFHLNSSQQEQIRLNESFCTFERKIQALEQEKKDNMSQSLLLQETKKDLKNEVSSHFSIIKGLEQKIETIEHEKRDSSRIDLSMSKVYKARTSVQKNQQREYLQLFFQILNNYRGTISQQQLAKFRLKISFLLSDQ